MSKTHYAEIEHATESFNHDYWESTLCGLREHEVDVSDRIEYVNCKKCLKIYNKRK